MNVIVYNTYQILDKFAQCEGRYISSEEKKVLLKILKEKEHYNDELLRVVLIGRTNAGKSTLTNAFAGKKIAHMKKRESTSWNTTFWPSEEEYCIGTDLNDEMHKLAIEEFVDIMNVKEKRAEYLKDKKSIDVFFKTEDINFAIFDIPGFATRTKENEITALEAVRQADVALFLIPADASVTGDDMALYQMISEMKIPVEIVINKSDRRDAEGLEEMRREIRDAFQWKREIYSLSAKECLAGNQDALQDRKRLINQIYQHQIIAKEERKIQNARFEAESILALKRLQEKVLHDIDRAFSNRYKEQVALYQKAENISQILRDALQNSIGCAYCEPYRAAIVQKLISIPVRELNVQKIENILKECIPETYFLEYWKKEVQYIEKTMNEVWEREISNTKQLYQYTNLLRNGRSAVRASYQISLEEERLMSGVTTSAGLGAAVSFYQAVLGPAAEYITLGSAFASVGLPLALIGAGISFAIGMMMGSEEEYLSQKNANEILQRQLLDNANEIVRFLIDISESINKQCIREDILLQEQKLLKSLPDGMQDFETVINTLEEQGTVLLNRELELKEIIDFYNNCPPEKVKEIAYIDPVEAVVDDFRRRLEALKAPAYINTSSRIPFMPLLFLSEENKEHVFSVMKEMCERSVPFENRIKDSKYEDSYCYEDAICAIYFIHKTGKKEIVLEYIDIYERDEEKVRQFQGKIREGSILSDCQMRKKIIEDIRRGKERVEILVPWMNRAVTDKAKFYKMSIADAIGEALKNGAQVIIGCGNSENPNKDREKKSKKMQEDMIEWYKDYYEKEKLVFHMRSFTHEKFLVVDNRIAMCGSYNYLSNNGRFDGSEWWQDENEKSGYEYADTASSGSGEHPGESMKITENIESIQMIRNRMYKKYG